MHRILNHLYCLIVGIITGFFAGLTGVGGGEFRLPFLVWLFKDKIKTAVAVNLVIGTLTVIFSLIKRLKYFEYSYYLIILSIIFFIFSIVGSYIGVLFIKLFSSRFIKNIIILYLMIIGIYMINEGLYYNNNVCIFKNDILTFFFTAVIAFTISAISVNIGVAGGEMRIPILIYLFGIDIKIAGTISLFASIPTVMTGAFKYKSYGYLDKNGIITSIIMGSGSLLGILNGVTFMNILEKHVLKVILGTILIIASLLLFFKLKNKH